MQTDPVPSASDDLLDPILVAYFEAESRGQAFDRTECIAAHPENAEALRRFFEDQDRLGLIVGPLHRLKEVLGTGIDHPGGSGSPASALHARTQSDARPGTHVPAEWPARFGEYEILGEIARGGMGIVFEARQSRPNRIVALKMIRDLHLAGEAERQRFRIEAEAAASLDHPNIVPVLEVGEHEGTVYFTMKRIVGCDLSRRLGEYSRDPRAVAQLVAKAARAVQHAHDRGILHRDLKPSNILIDERGEPHLTDFGLAKRVEAEGGLTISGLLIGTPEYLSPEQASGEVRAVTTAADVYGLGAVLYALLTRRPPFHEKSVLETLRRVREDPPTPPSRIAGSIDRDLETVCLKCLEKVPGSRYARPSALADDLERWLRGEPIDARPVGRWERVRRWCRRNPAVAALSAGLVTVVASALVAGVVMLDRIRRESAEAVAQSLRAGANIRHALHGISRLHARVQDRGLDRLPEAAALRRDISRQALALLRTIVDGEQPGPSVAVDIASTLQHISEIEFNDGRLSEADAAMSRSIALLDELLAGGPDDGGALYLRAQSHHILALQHAASGRHDDVSAHCEQAERDYRRCLARDPDGFDALNGTSWFLAIAPDPSFRAPEEAVALARRGVSIFPRSAGLWNDLGVALHRAGRWAEAVTALETSRRLRADPDSAHDGFFLTMALARLGRRDEARERFGRAAAWMDRNDPRHHELLLFRAEALATLDATCPMPDGPDAFLNR